MAIGAYSLWVLEHTYRRYRSIIAVDIGAVLLWMLLQYQCGYWNTISLGIRAQSLWLLEHNHNGIFTLDVGRLTYALSSITRAYSQKSHQHC